MSYDHSISRKTNLSTETDKNSSKNVDSGGRAALKMDKKTVKAVVKMKADYKTDTVFRQAAVDRALSESKALGSLPRGMKKTLAEEIFLDMNESLNEGGEKSASFGDTENETLFVYIN